MWRCDFKYNNELTLVFISSNQIGDFFNRLKASRKYLFGSMGALCGANSSVISGVFITRGDDIKLSVDCAPDWESYEYKRLDLTNDSDKKSFEDALAWDLELGGKKWTVGKNVGHFKCVVAEELQAADRRFSLQFKYVLPGVGIQRGHVMYYPCAVYCYFSPLSL